MIAYKEDDFFRCTLSLKPLLDYLKQNEAAFKELAPCADGALTELLDQAPELLEPIDDPSILERYSDQVKKLMSLVFPPVFWNTEAVGAVVPLSMQPFWISPGFKRLFLNDEGDFISNLNLDETEFKRGRLIRAYLLILEKFYGIQQKLDYPVIHTVADPETGLERHYKMSIDLRFVNAHAVGEPKKLTQAERATILEHLTEPEILKEILPFEDFELQGFTVLQAIDVTESEVISALERDLIDQESIISREGFLQIQQRLRTLLRRPGLVAGIAAIQEDQVLLLNSGSEMTQHCIFADSQHVPISEFDGTVYEQAVLEGTIQRVPDVMETYCPEHMKKDMFLRGVRSLLIIPLQYKGEVIGTLDLGSTKPGDLTPMDALMMNQIQPLFSIAIKKALDDLDNSVQGVIKENCTAIHPAVEWRFRKAAITHLENLRRGQASEMEPIIFKDVYPLYGISDIRGSTHARNNAIQGDMVEHLKLAQDVVNQAAEARSLLIMRELSGRIEDQVLRIQKELRTGDELSTLNFLQDEVESIFPHLKGFGPKVNRAIERYESRVDKNTGSVYRLRKDFEESVSLLNQSLASYLDQEEAEVQGLFPHYFERHRTDGVDYIIYIGGSLLDQGTFDALYLKNLRLWQIKVAAGIAWHTEKLKSSLKVPLDTAHLVLVQNTPLSIRFRFDEKRFDVDGAYDIRQEIIKSRIDKAVVKQDGERLTQPEKIAIVYSHPEEVQEIRRHIDFLQKEGYLTGEVEDLELEDLPGIQGLKSLRIGVNLESKVLSERLQRMVA